MADNPELMPGRHDNLSPEQELRRLLLHDDLPRLDQLDARLGSDQALHQSLVPVIAGVLRDAGVKQPRQLAASLTPLVVSAIRTEIRNSRDMMVDALYPITGQLVAAAVRNAFKDLLDQLNAKLDSTLSTERLSAKIKAFMTGRSEAEVLLGRGAALEIADIWLIERQSGLMIARADEQAEDSQLVSGTLTALMAFVRDAVDDTGEHELRTLDLGDVSLHLQVSPTVITAVKTRGVPPAGFARALDQAFRAFLERWGEDLQDTRDLAPDERQALSEDLATRLEGLLEARRRGFRGPSRKGTILVSLLALALLGGIGWYAYDRYQENRILAEAHALIDSRPALAGYPLTIDYPTARGALLLTGLTPDQASADRLGQDFEEAGLGVPLDFRLRPLDDDGEAADLSAVRASIDEIRAGTAMLERGRAADRQELEGQVRALAALSTDLGEQLADLRGVLKRPDPAIDAALARFDQTAAGLAGRLERLSARLEQGSAARDFLLLQDWFGRQTIRFRAGAALIDEAGAGDLLDEIGAALDRLPSAARLRIVGYGDDSGTAEANQEVAENRANYVAGRLVAKGVPSSRLDAVGRGNERRLSPASGVGSPNRRIEFELLLPPSLPEAGAAGRP
jgi:outer membrane protein OmpA-like peptidoglycan-associated protein